MRITRTWRPAALGLVGVLTLGTAVGDWLATAKHPKTGRPYTEMTYQPMLELLAYLRSNGFKTFIVSGGGVEFVRAFARREEALPTSSRARSARPCHGSR